MDIVALIISLLFLLLTLVLLWLARRMRMKRPQVRELRAEHAALLDRQRAALEALRATDAQGQVESLPEQQEPFLMPDSDQ